MFSRYIPQHFYDNYHEIDKKNYIAVRGYVMCAELTGFSALCDKMSSEGKKGSEEASAAIKKIFEHLLKIINKRGGATYKLSTDSITVFFPDSVPSRSVNNCGMELLNEMKDMKNIKTSAGKFIIGFRIGASYGKIFIGQLGKNEKEYFITGQALDNAVECSEAAGKGEFLLSCSLRFRLGMCDLKTKNNRYYIAEKIEELFDTPQADHKTGKLRNIELFIRKAVTDIERENGSGYGEFRYGTVLCLALEGIDHGSGFDHPKLNDLVTDVFRLSSKYGGLVNKIDLKLTDDKIIIVFGILESDGNSERNAAKCALDILKESADNSGISMAINSGQIYFGISGASFRHEFLAVGNTVSMCIRLMNSAKLNEIIISENSASKIKEAVLDNAREKGFKGIRTKLKIFSLKDFKTKEESSAAKLLGKDDEIKKYSTAISEGSVRNVFIAGKSGTSRSMLSKAFSAISSKKGKIFGVWCGKETECIPYFTVINLINDFLLSMSSDKNYALKKILTDIKESHNFDVISRLLSISQSEGKYIDRALKGVIDDVIVSLFGSYLSIYRSYIFIEGADFIDNCSLNVLCRYLKNKSTDAVLHFAYENEDRISCYRSGKDELDFEIKSLNIKETAPTLKANFINKKFPAENFKDGAKKKISLINDAIRYYDIFCYDASIEVLNEYRKLKLTVEEKAVSYLLEAEICRIGRNFEKGIDLCDRIKEMFCKENEYFIKASFLKIHIFYDMASYDDAIAEAVIFENCYDKNLSAKAKCLKGLSQLEKGLTASAEITVAEAYTIKNELSDAEAGAMVFQLSGRFEFSRSRNTIARAYFEDMLRVSQENQLSGKILSALRDISLCYENEGANKKALEMLDRLCEESIKMHNFDHALESIHSCFRNSTGSERKAVFYSDRWLNAANRSERLFVSESIRELLKSKIQDKSVKDRNEYR